MIYIHYSYNKLYYAQRIVGDKKSKKSYVALKLFIVFHLSRSVQSVTFINKEYNTHRVSNV